MSDPYSSDPHSTRDPARDPRPADPRLDPRPPRMERQAAAEAESTGWIMPTVVAVLVVVGLAGYLLSGDRTRTTAPGAPPETTGQNVQPSVPPRQISPDGVPANPTPPSSPAPRANPGPAAPGAPANP